MGLSSLLVHKLRTMLTMMGMIFGVGAVVAMLAITAGVEKEMLSYIDMLGVNNIIIEAKEAVDRNELQARRAISPGLTFRDFRAIKENTQGIELATPRKRFKPAKVIPKTAAEPPVLIGVEPAYEQIQSIRVVEGRFFTAEEDAQSAPVCVLGESAKVNLLGYEPAVGKYVKLNEVWLQVIGVMAQQAGADTDVEGVEILSRNNLVVAPLNTVMRRFEDGNSYLKDEIDGIYMRVVPGTDSIEVAGVVTAILTATHKDAGDFTVTVPAGLLEQKKRTSDIFKVVMICIAGISLLVGGIGIMNIMLATVLERTREIGIRRAIGARQKDIIRQFLTEAVMISIIGGLIGILFGFTLSRVIAAAAGWSTVVTFASIAVAFGVSVGIGLLFGIYPAVQAAKLDPIEAIRYE
ncbi:MAG: ABC transporter permease [Bryobacteraceae bacterium]|jgi:putative ABC transport system permease protein|nr:ABC transporter permease [Solibacteraceae bacterium]MCL4844068.1 ABC transporter permease [Bryobacteraceae bacterium]HAX42222.1 multidrug ABC transporter substrate-binding protein [Bryobacterales bacterium]